MSAKTLSRLQNLNFVATLIDIREWHDAGLTFEQIDAEVFGPAVAENYQKGKFCESYRLRHTAAGSILWNLRKSD